MEIGMGKCALVIPKEDVVETAERRSSFSTEASLDILMLGSPMPTWECISAIPNWATLWKSLPVVSVGTDSGRFGLLNCRVRTMLCYQYDCGPGFTVHFGCKCKMNSRCVDKEHTKDLVVNIFIQKTVFGFTNSCDSDYITQAILCS